MKCSSMLRLAMFDYIPEEHGRTIYQPAPAWSTIAADDNTAAEADYARVERSLLAQGEPYSRRGGSAHLGQPVFELGASPIPVNLQMVANTIERVMAQVHPLAVTQEQILRGAFFGGLPRELGETIGTAGAAVHPERPTPSSDYVFKGTRGVGMRARYDLGFGHPTESAGIAGVAELKAGLWTFDRLESMSRFDGDAGAEAQSPPDEIMKLEEPLLLDLLKLLDPRLPERAFRISWVASGKRGRSCAAEIRERALRIVERVAKKRNLSGLKFHIDPLRGWLVCVWPAPEVVLQLAWYRPEASNLEKFEAVFGNPR